jgi:hypothetical protein
MFGALLMQSIGDEHPTDTPPSAPPPPPWFWHLSVFVLQICPSGHPPHTSGTTHVFVAKWHFVVRPVPAQFASLTHCTHTFGVAVSLQTNPFAQFESVVQTAISHVFVVKLHRAPDWHCRSARQSTH